MPATRKTTKKTTAKKKKKTTRKRASSRSALPRKTAKQKERAQAILDDLYQEYPDAHCELDYTNPHELLIATILSAQATDVGVNKATPKLFRKFKTPAAYAKVTPEDIQPYIASIGLYRNKSKSIHAAMTTIVEEFDGKVPQTMDELLRLRGVARKTANVVLGNAFNINEGVVVDTHVMRLSQRFNLSRQKTPEKVEKDLMALFPRDHWTMLSHLLIFHGRRVCKARGETCAEHWLCQKWCKNAKA